MFAINGYLIVALVIVAYGLAVYGLYRAGLIGADRSLSLLGPALMIKTRRGRAALDRWGRFRRLWSAAGDLGILLAAASMVAMIALLLLDAYVSLSLTAAQAPTPQEALGLPGINPIIPIGYGLVALVIGIVLHELMHGVLARSQKVGVKSLGILWCVVPIGAFVEQDDEEMQRASRRSRDRIAAAGILANFALAVVFFLLLAAVLSGGIAANANGVGVVQVVAHSPAANASLAPGDIITAVNGTPITSTLQFENLLAASHPHQVVTVGFYSDRAGRVVTELVPLARNPTNGTRGFLGVAVNYLTPTQLKATWVSPLTSAATPQAGLVNWLVLPLATLEPVAAPTTGFFHLTGIWASVDPGTFWIGANLLYWLSWMNLLLGASNALPLIPLDGGLLVRDYAAALMARLRKGWSSARLDDFGGRVAVTSSLIVVLLIVWQFIVPRLG